MGLWIFAWIRRRSVVFVFLAPQECCGRLSVTSGNRLCFFWPKIGFYRFLEYSLTVSAFSTRAPTRPCSCPCKCPEFLHSLLHNHVTLHSLLHSLLHDRVDLHRRLHDYLHGRVRLHKWLHGCVRLLHGCVFSSPELRGLLHGCVGGCVIFEFFITSPFKLLSSSNQLEYFPNLSKASIRPEK